MFYEVILTCLKSRGKMARDFLKLRNVFSLTQMVTEPTGVISFLSNALDLTITNRPDFLTEIACLPGISDHFVLYCKICLDRTKQLKSTKQAKISQGWLWRYK